MKKRCFAPLALALAVDVAFGAVPVLPVSDACNPMYLKGMADKPWWNDAWRQRLPVVVSESSTNAVAAYVADFSLDLGNPGLADSVRVVTDYGEEVPCWCEEERAKTKGEGEGRKGVVRLQFKTQLNALENKSFHVYFDNPKAPKSRPADEVVGFENGPFLTLRNSALTLDFATKTTNPDTLRRFKVNGSLADNELALQPSRTADCALKPILRHDLEIFTNRVSLAVATPFKKQVMVENDHFTARYTLYAESDRLDFAYVTKNPKNLFIQSLSTAWAPGGGRSWDDLLYPSLRGTINTDRAQIDYRSDMPDTISHGDIGDWCGEGWLAFYDRKTATSVGQFYSPADVQSVGFGAWSGSARCHSLNIRMCSPAPGKTQGEIRGAAFGTKDRADLIGKAYRIWANPPKVIVGTAEPWRRIEVRPPDMARDFCSFQQLGPDDRTVKRDIPGLPEETAANIAAYLKRDGFNGAHLVHAATAWWAWNPDRTLYDEIFVAATNKTYGGDGQPPASWADSVLQSRNMRVFLDGLHVRGIGAYHWGSNLYGSDALFSQVRARELDIAIKGVANAKMGFDATWCPIQGHEGPMLWDADWARVGVKFWQYKDPKDRVEFLRLQDIRIAHARAFSEAVRAAGGKSLCWGCDLGLLGNDQFSLDNAGDFDVVIQELMIGHMLERNERNRFGIARMRAMFDNEPRTVWNHFWSRIAGDDIRVGNCDLPFLYGVNGFNQEGDDYRQADVEIVTKGTDFYRFAYNTGLAAVSPKFAPVKHYVVFRDSLDHRADILESRTGRTWMRKHCWEDVTETDGAANNWTTCAGMQCDLVVNRFFALESLKRYPVLVLPHNYKLTKERFEIVKRYVAEGGVCYAEGAQFPFAKFFTDGATPVAGSKWGFVKKSHGKGKLLYSPQNPSLSLGSLEPGEEFRTFIAAEAGRPEPFAVEPKYACAVDGMLRTDGKNWMFGTFALDLPGGTSTVVRVKLNLPPTTSASNSFFVLDMKSGRRQPFDGTLTFVQHPRQTTNFLIGDDAFTSVPAHAVAPISDFGAIREGGLLPGAAKNLAECAKLGDFRRPLAVLLFQDPADPTSVGEKNVTIARGAFEQILFSRANYAKSAFAEAVGSASLVHFKEVKADILEKVFAESSDALKALLKRGGGIMFDRSPTTPAAKRFLKEIGVYDPCEARITGGDYWGQADFDALGKKHVLYTKPRDIYQPWVGNRMQASACYPKWDTEKQIAPFVVVDRDSPVKGKKHAMCVCQDKVLGAGRVIFQENHGAFTTWYEGVTYGENLFSYAIGMDLKEHKRKVTLLYGGVGTPVKFPEIIRNKF